MQLIGNAQILTYGGIDGGSLYIPQGEDYGNIPIDCFLNETFTVQFWVKQSTEQPFLQELVRKGDNLNNYNFRVYKEAKDQKSDGRITAGFTDDQNHWIQTWSNNSNELDQWNLITFLKNPYSHELYINAMKVFYQN